MYMLLEDRQGMDLLEYSHSSTASMAGYSTVLPDPTLGS